MFSVAGLSTLLLELIDPLVRPVERGEHDAKLPSSSLPFVKLGLLFEAFMSQHVVPIRRKYERESLEKNRAPRKIQPDGKQLLRESLSVELSEAPL